MAKKQTAPAAEVLPATTPEQIEVQGDGKFIGGWLLRLGPFFQQALVLEATSKALAERGSKLALPTTAEEDVAVQKFCQETAAHIRTVNEHWTITSIVHRFHRRLTGRRDLAVKPAEAANERGQSLHRQYVQAEERRVREEENRRREQAEFEARELRRQEQEAAEAEALEREAASPDLSERERKFVDAVSVGHGMQQAARFAGYKDVVKMVDRLMASPKIQAALKAKQAADAIRKQAAVRAAEPITPVYEPVEAKVERATGVSERTTWSAEVFDAAALVEAFRSGQYGIPGDLFQVNPAKANEYARSLQERLDRWPGIRARKTTKVY